MDRLEHDSLVGGPFDTGLQLDDRFMPSYSGAGTERMHNRLADAQPERVDLTNTATRINYEIGGMVGTVPAIGWTDYLQTGVEEFWLDGRMARQRQMRPNPATGPVGGGKDYKASLAGALDFPAYSEQDIQDSLLRMA